MIIARANVLASILGTFFGNPITFPFIAAISVRFGNFRGYDTFTDEDRGSVEVQGVWEHETYQNPLHEIPQGMSKVEEEIWKLKNKKV